MEIQENVLLENFSRIKQFADYLIGSIEPLIIAEVKTQTPHGSWRAKKTWDELLEIAIEIGNMVAIHTDFRWGGSFDLVRRAVRRTRKPILAKGYHGTDDLVRRAFDAGAAFTLVVGRIPCVMPGRCLIEVNAVREFKILSKGTLAAWNARWPLTGEEKTETFEEARRAWSGFLCQASLIKTVEDIKPGADAVLVGTYLPEFAESLKESRHRELGS